MLSALLVPPHPESSFDVWCMAPLLTSALAVLLEVSLEDEPVLAGRARHRCCAFRAEKEGSWDGSSWGRSARQRVRIAAAPLPTKPESLGTDLITDRRPLN